MKNRKNSIYYDLFGIVCVVLLTFFDQWTKKWAVGSLKGTEGITLIQGVFRLSYLENHGAAFGIFQNQIWFFVILTVIYLAAAVWFYRKLPLDKKYHIMRLAAILLTAGAIGNFIDRVRFHYVVDFFYFCLIDFPIFNVADIFVVGAFILVLICILFVYKDDDFSFLRIGSRN